jgi:biotin operon repressor
MGHPKSYATTRLFVNEQLRALEDDGVEVAVEHALERRLSEEEPSALSPERTTALHAMSPYGPSAKKA